MDGPRMYERRSPEPEKVAHSGVLPRDWPESDWALGQGSELLSMGSGLN